MTTCSLLKLHKAIKTKPAFLHIQTGWKRNSLSLSSLVTPQQLVSAKTRGETLPLFRWGKPNPQDFRLCSYADSSCFNLRRPYLWITKVFIFRLGLPASLWLGGTAHGTALSVPSSKPLNPLIDFSHCWETVTLCSSMKISSQIVKRGSPKNQEKTVKFHLSSDISWPVN